MEKGTLLLQRARSISLLSNSLWKIYFWHKSAVQTLLQGDQKTLEILPKNVVFN